MVKVDIGRDENLFYLDMTGHAKNDTAGSPEVCAACSAIAYTLLGWSVNNQFIEAGYVESDGLMHVDVDVIDKSCAVQWETAAVWEAIEIGLRQIAQAYPQFVSVN